ncbi:PREDICTED: uncharacterized protein LOC109160208 [Ipomoea nil]|uniref:uncharacterized protein LOC109160208 n=1 Tax=Ipomoea nil TaxID=35883 RepID=UPI00090096B5|nr:PREDICTED: uncharacterized protein LOC109160208 [Ipomoea nil]
MASRFLLLALIFCYLSLNNNVYSIQPQQIIPNLKFPAKKVDPKLIATACDHSKGGEACVKWLNDKENDPEISLIEINDMRDLAFFALKKIEKEAVNVSEAVEMKLNNGSEVLPPETQQGLSDCREHYVPAVDLIEEAVDSVGNKAFPDAVKFLQDAILDLNACEESLKKITTDPTTKNPTKADQYATMAINHRDVLESHVVITQSILNLAASGGGGGGGAPAAAPSS